MGMRWRRGRRAWPERARLREDYDHRTRAGDLIARYEANGWEGFGFTEDEAGVFQENLDAVMARVLAAQDGES